MLLKEHGKEADVVCAAIQQMSFACSGGKLVTFMSIKCN